MFVGRQKSSKNHGKKGPFGEPILRRGPFRVSEGAQRITARRPPCIFHHLVVADFIFQWPLEAVVGGTVITLCTDEPTAQLEQLEQSHSHAEPKPNTALAWCRVRTSVIGNNAPSTQMCDTLWMICHRTRRDTATFCLLQPIGSMPFCR